MEKQVAKIPRKNAVGEGTEHSGQTGQQGETQSEEPAQGTTSSTRGAIGSLGKGECSDQRVVYKGKCIYIMENLLQGRKNRGRDTN